MWNGIAIGIGRSGFSDIFAGSYATRVTADGGTIEALTCVAAASSLLKSASLLIIPSGYKAGIAYAELPTNGNGDLTWSRNSVANRTNASGLIQQVPYNLLRQSETFTDAVWIKQSGGENSTPVQALDSAATTQNTLQKTRQKNPSPAYDQSRLREESWLLSSIPARAPSAPPKAPCAR